MISGSWPLPVSRCNSFGRFAAEWWMFSDWVGEWPLVSGMKNLEVSNLHLLLIKRVRHLCVTANNNTWVSSLGETLCKHSEVERDSRKEFDWKLYLGPAAIECIYFATAGQQQHVPTTVRRQRASCFGEPRTPCCADFALRDLVETISMSQAVKGCIKSGPTGRFCMYLLGAASLGVRRLFLGVLGERRVCSAGCLPACSSGKGPTLQRFFHSRRSCYLQPALCWSGSSSYWADQSVWCRHERALC